MVELAYRAYGPAAGPFADDSTAGYYNPAGLVQLPGFTLSAAADIYGLYLLDRTEQVNDQGANLARNAVLAAGSQLIILAPR